MGMATRTGLSTRDFIAPTGFEFREGRRFRMGGTLGAVSFLQILAPELNDRMLADFLNMESSLIVSLHIQSIDQTAAIRQIKRKITELDQSKIDEQKKAIRAGYDIDILPSDLATYGGEAKKLLEDLQSHNERMFLVTFLVMNTASTRQQLETACSRRRESLRSTTARWNGWTSSRKKEWYLLCRWDLIRSKSSGD